VASPDLSFDLPAKKEVADATAEMAAEFGKE